MKRFLLLLLLLATPAFGYGNRVTEAPDYEYTTFAWTCSTWCTSFASGFSTGYVTRVGKQVVLCAQINANTTAGISGPLAFGGIPASMRPYRDAFTIISANIGTWKNVIARVRTTGELWIYGDTAAGNYPSSTVFSTNSGDQICLTYNLH